MSWVCYWCKGHLYFAWEILMCLIPQFDIQSSIRGVLTEVMQERNDEQKVTEQDLLMALNQKGFGFNILMWKLMKFVSLTYRLQQRLATFVKTYIKEPWWWGCEFTCCSWSIALNGMGPIQNSIGKELWMIN